MDGRDGSSGSPAHNGRFSVMVTIIIGALIALRQRDATKIFNFFSDLPIGQSFKLKSFVVMGSPVHVNVLVPDHAI